MAYLTVAEFRNFTSLTTAEISDAVFTALLPSATARINRDLQEYFEDERVRYISVDKKNYVNGSNTEYYAYNKYLGDYDDGGDIDVDDIYVYSFNGTGTLTTYTVSSIDSVRLGKFTLTAAPASGERLYISYAAMPVINSPVHELIKHATAQLVAALSYSKLDAGLADKWKVGRISVSNMGGSYKRWFGLYQGTLNSLWQIVLSREDGVNVV